MKKLHNFRNVAIKIIPQTCTHSKKELDFYASVALTGVFSFKAKTTNVDLRASPCPVYSGFIKDIKQFMAWCVEGSSTYAQRRELLETRRKAVEAEMEALRKTLDMLKFKCWYYETAIRDGGEEQIQAMMPDQLPPDIQKLYDNGRQ